MADLGSDSGDSFWGDVGKAFAALLVSAGLTALQNSLTGAGRSKTSSMEVTLPESRPRAVFPTGNFTAVAGKYMLWERNPEAEDNGVTTHVIAVSGWEVESFDNEVFIGDDKAAFDGSGNITTITHGTDDGRYVDGRVQILYRLGLATETAISEVVSDQPVLWSTNHRGDGIGYIAVRYKIPTAKFLAEAFPVGPQKVRPILRAKFYDWRNGAQSRTDSSTWGASGNPVVCIVNAMWRKFDMDWTKCIAPNLTLLTNEANACDASVAKVGGGTRRRYAHGGVFEDDLDVATMLQNYSECMGGMVSRDGKGALVVRCGRWVEPTRILTADHIISANWKLGFDASQRVGRLNVSFTSTDTFTQRDCEPWVVDAAYDRTEDFYPAWCQDWEQARALAKIYANDVNPEGFGTIVTDEHGRFFQNDMFMRVQYADNPDLADRYLKIKSCRRTGDGYVFTVISTDPEVYNFNPSLHSGNDPGDVTAVIDGRLGAPVITALTAFYDSAGGATAVRLRLVVTGPPRADLTWFARVRQTGTTLWAPDIQVTHEELGSGVVTFDTTFVTAASSLDVEVYYITGSKQPSPFSATSTLNTAVAPGGTFESFITEDGELLLTEAGESLTTE